MKLWIYCGRDAGAVHVHHTISQAAGSSIQFRRTLGELTVPPGLACIKCNANFGHDLDQSLARHPYILQWRAVYGMRSHAHAKTPVYEDRPVRIETTPAGVLMVSGPGVDPDRQGNLKVPRPSLEEVDHFFVSRAIHRAALEHELIRISKDNGIEAARQAAGRRPLDRIARYIRSGQRRDYRPYGVEGHGCKMVNPSSRRDLPAEFWPSI